MNTRTSAFPFFLGMALYGCSTPQTEPAVLTALEPPAPEISVDLPLEPPVVGHVCKLGTSCLELDKRPFEPCLVGTKHCADKGVELLETQVPKKPPTETPQVMPVSHDQGKAK